MALRFSPARGAASLVLNSMVRGPKGAAASIPDVTVDNGIPRWDGLRGDLQNSGVFIDDSDNVFGSSNLSITFISNGVVAATSIPASVRSFSTLGYSAANDGGRANYDRAEVQSAGVGKIQSMDGAWWEISDHALRPEMFGALGFSPVRNADGYLAFIPTVADDSDALNDAMQAATLLQRPLIISRGHLVTKTLGDNDGLDGLRIHFTVGSYIVAAAAMTGKIFEFLSAARVTITAAEGATIDTSFRSTPGVGQDWSSLSFENPTADIVVDGLRFRAGDARGACGGDTHIFVASYTRIRITNITLQGCSDAAIYLSGDALGIENAQNAFIDNITADDCYSVIECKRTAIRASIGKVTARDCSVGIAMSEGGTSAALLPGRKSVISQLICYNVTEPFIGRASSDILIQSIFSEKHGYDKNGTLVAGCAVVALLGSTDCLVNSIVADVGTGSSSDVLYVVYQARVTLGSNNYDPSNNLFGTIRSKGIRYPVYETANASLNSYEMVRATSFSGSSPFSFNGTGSNGRFYTDTGTVISVGTQSIGVLGLSNTGLRIDDTDASHIINFKPATNLTQNQTFSLYTGDVSARFLDISAADVTISSYATTLLDDTSAGAVRTTLGLGTSATVDTGTSGAKVPVLNAANTWSLSQTFTVAPTFTDQSGSRTALGLGTAATQNTGTSGANVPLMNGANAWSAAQSITAANNPNTGILKLQSTGSFDDAAISFFPRSSPAAGQRAFQIAINYGVAGAMDFLAGASDGANPTTLAARLSSGGNFSSVGWLKSLVTTVTSLPSAATAGAGARAFVTDSNSTTFGATVAGSGSNNVPVYSDGTNWKIG